MWLRQLVSRGAIFCIPEIADYELRRELIRIVRTESIRRLDELKATLSYVPITTATMLKAAEFWASARAAGRPTADDKALDADAILAAQSIDLAEPGSDVIVATTNVSHLTRFVQARLWRDIS